MGYDANPTIPSHPLGNFSKKKYSCPVLSSRPLFTIYSQGMPTTASSQEARTCQDKCCIGRGQHLGDVAPEAAAPPPPATGYICRILLWAFDTVGLGDLPGTTTGRCRRTAQRVVALSQSCGRCRPAASRVTAAGPPPTKASSGRCLRHVDEPTFSQATRRY